MTTAIADAPCYREAFARGLAPDPIQTYDQWADEQFVLPAWSSEPGRIRLDRTPFLREILRCLSPSSPVQRVVFMKPGQIGATTCGNIWIGGMIHRFPTTMLVVEPTVDLAKKFSRQRVAAMLRDVRVLKGLVAEAKSRDAGNTILAKEFAGGMLVMTGANSGPGLRFMSARNLFLDEVDAYPFDVDGEGSPVDLAEKRTDSYSFPKIYLTSTPLLKSTSVIEREYEASDRRRYHVPCPHCGTEQVLWWTQLKWPKGEPEKAAYECASCHRLIAEFHKGDMLTHGRWIAERPEITDVAGFHLNALYTPYGWKNSWAALAKRWTKVIHKKDRGQQQAFTNLNLAETWSGDEMTVEGSALYRRRETYPAPAPDGVLFLTGMVDLQDDRLEAEAVGHGVGEESWSIEKVIFYGSPAKPDVWTSLDLWRQKPWMHERGISMKLSILLVDTGGHHTKEAYAWILPREAERVYAIKGSNQPGAPLVSRPSKHNLGHVNLFMIGTNTAKDTLFARLKSDAFGPGYMHFPVGDAYDEEYFDQLAAESRAPKYDRGVLVGHVYKKNRARNEEIDLWVGNMAALAIAGVDLEAITLEGLRAAQAQEEALAPRRQTGESWVGAARPERPTRDKGGWLRR